MTLPETEKFMRSLPRLSANDTLLFRCHPEVSCFNRCCGDLNLALSPYDVMRLRVALGVNSTEFMRKYAEVTPLEGNGFPSVMLKMETDADQSCPFVLPEGCSVYPHRPGACRVYPLGRGASIDDDGNLTEEFLLVNEPHCRGFQEAPEAMTVSEYLDDQGMRPYIKFDNRYIQVMHRWNARGRHLDQSLFSKVFVAAYRPDELSAYVGDPSLTAHIVKEDRDTETYETALLAFGFDWIERALFGEHP